MPTFGIPLKDSVEMGLVAFLLLVTHLLVKHSVEQVIALRRRKGFFKSPSGGFLGKETVIVNRRSQEPSRKR